MPTDFIPSSPHKNTAIILGATGNLAFALAVVLKGLKRHNAPLLQEADIIIYYQNMSQPVRDALNAIAPCRGTGMNSPTGAIGKRHAWPLRCITRIRGFYC